MAEAYATEIEVLDRLHAKTSFRNPREIPLCVTREAKNVANDGRTCASGMLKNVANDGRTCASGRQRGRGDGTGTVPISGACGRVQPGGDAAAPGSIFRVVTSCPSMKMVFAGDSVARLLCLPTIADGGVRQYPTDAASLASRAMFWLQVLVNCGECGCRILNETRTKLSRLSHLLITRADASNVAVCQLDVRLLCVYLVLRVKF